MKVKIDLEKAAAFLDKDRLTARKEEAAAICRELFTRIDTEQVLGWRDRETSAVQLELIKAKAEEIRREADVFIIVGVGGSNQASRAMIKALAEDDKPQILYLGNTLSPHYINKVLKKMEGKSVYFNVIAKNFETLEPGSHFRILRHWMAARYSEAETAKRIIVTGSPGSRSEQIADQNGYLFLPFPPSVGGRYSVFSPVCLFPVTVAGLDTDAYLAGMEAARADIGGNPGNNLAVDYAAARNLLYQQGYDIEMLAVFEPQYACFTRWWVQMFGETEGKDGKGIFPAGAVYSEDLHAIGQYMQEGRRNLLETFLSVTDPGDSLTVEADPEADDGFAYLDGKDFREINRAAEEATWKAHSEGGVPCLRIEVDAISEATFGALYYYFITACVISATLMGVNPFNQDGVEAYKKSMFRALGKQPGKYDKNSSCSNDRNGYKLRSEK